MSGNTNLQQVLSKMEIKADDIEYGFACVDGDALKSIEGVVATFKETEGMTVIAPVKALAGTAYEGPFAKLTILVHTSLELVGLTAVLATKLTEANISANVVAGFYHDHVFVQYEQRDRATAILNELKSV